MFTSTNVNFQTHTNSRVSLNELPFFFHPNPPSFLQYIAHEMCMTEGDEQLSAPSKEQLDQEKQLLLAFKPVMQKFLHDHVDLQVSALYALQVHCNTNGFPKGKGSRAPLPLLSGAQAFSCAVGIHLVSLWFLG